MIVLVLNDAGRKALRRNLETLAVAAEGLDAHVARPRHQAADVGNAETALPAFVIGVADDRQFRIDQRHQRHVGVVVHLGDDRPRARPATKIRSDSCTCGPASPMPAYSDIVSNMSSTSR